MQQVDLTSFFLIFLFFEIFQKKSLVVFRLRSKLCTLKPPAPPLVLFFKTSLQVLCCAADIVLSIIVIKKKEQTEERISI